MKYHPTFTFHSRIINSINPTNKYDIMGSHKRTQQTILHNQQHIGKNRLTLHLNHTSIEKLNFSTNHQNPYFPI